MNPRHPGLPPDIPGYFSVADGRSHGLDRESMRSRHLEQRVYGVRGPAGSADDLAERCRLFASRLPDEVFFSHSTAARLMGLPIPRSFERMRRLHVTIAAPGRAPHAAGIIGHSRRVLDGDVAVAAGVRVSSPVRIACEMASVLDVAHLVALVDHLIHHRGPRCSRDDLASRLQGGDRLARSRLLRRALVLADDRAESPPESILRVILTLAGIRPTAVNLAVVVGDRGYRLDLAYERERVAVEYQGAHHFELVQGRRDMSRRSHLETAGWTVVEVNSDDLADPADVIRRVRAALARATSR